MKRDTLLLPDLENLSLSMRQYRERELDPRELVTAAGGWGRLLEARAYVDLRKPGVPDALIRQVEAAGIRVCHVPSRSNGSKDLVDHALAADLIEAAATRRVRRIVLASGDGHYLPALVCALRYVSDLSILAVEGSLSADLAALVPADAVTFLRGGRSIRDLARVDRASALVRTAA